MKIRFAEHFSLTEQEVKETSLSWFLASLEVITEDSRKVSEETKKIRHRRLH